MSLAPRPRYKLVFLGNESVGKTAIIKRFMHDTFDESHKVTIGIDFCSKTLTLDDRVIRLQLWDTAGQERFRSLIPSYIRDSSVAIVVYDVTDRESFESARQWVEDVRFERGDQVLMMLVGNKTDQHDSRQVSFEEGDAKAKEWRVMFIETSALANFNIKPLFQKIALALPGSSQSVQQDGGVNVTLESAVKLPDNQQACCGYA